MICWVEMVLVRSTILTRGDLAMMARMASRPGSRGMATSSSKISGSSSRVWVMASSPSLASPTTSNPGSLSSMFLTPKRTTGWSSATTIRMVAMPFAEEVGFLAGC
jgi:hypothetical protein